MALNLATLNVRGLRDTSKWAHLLWELYNLSVNVAAVQKTHFTCAEMLEDDCVVLSAYGGRRGVGVSLLIGPSFNTDVNLVLTDDRGQLVVADIAVKVLSSGWSSFMRPILLQRGFPFIGGWNRSSTIQNG